MLLLFKNAALPQRNPAAPNMPLLRPGLFLLLSFAFSRSHSQAPHGRPAPPGPAAAIAPSEDEARVRAQLLHAAFRGALEIMHRDFFRKGDSKAIPSESLTDVFKAMGGEWGVTIRWLASEATIMNVDNKAQDAFEVRALKSITGGEKEVSTVENGSFRYAGAIVLENQCLKCHVPDRTSLEDRFAALEICMPVKRSAAVPPKP
jgi:Protein of unknown function (DUF3365)